MNSKERLAAFLAGEVCDRRPNLTIVGSVVTRYSGISVETYCKDPIAMAKSAISAAEDLGLDFVQIASDLVREAEAFGAEIKYSEDALPTLRVPALSDIGEVSSLKPLRTADTRRLNDLVEATAYAREACAEVDPMTLVVGPATVAANTRGLEDFLMDTYDDEDACRELLAIVTETALNLIRELAGVGSRYIYVADPVASLFSGAQYEALIAPCQKQLFDCMRELGIVSRLHMCGNTQRGLPISSKLGMRILDIDHEVDYARALLESDESVILNGNIDPVADVYSCDAAHTYQAIIDLAASVANDRRAMFMPGCELPRLTDLENVRAITKALWDIGC